jgi:hypothetical protein
VPVLAGVESRLDVGEAGHGFGRDQVGERLLDHGDRRCAEQRLGRRVQVGELAALEVERQVGVRDPVDRGPQAAPAVQRSSPAAARPALRLGRTQCSPDAGAEAGLETAQRLGHARLRLAQAGDVDGDLDRLLERCRGVAAEPVERGARRVQVDGGESAEAAEATHDLATRRRRRLPPAQPSVHLVLDRPPVAVQEANRIPEDRSVHLAHPHTIEYRTAGPWTTRRSSR